MVFRQNNEFLLGLITICSLGCGGGDTIDPTIDLKQQQDLTLALAMSPAVADFTPLKVVDSKNEASQWVVTIIQENHPEKRGKFRVDKASKKAERLPD